MHQHKCAVEVNESLQKCQIWKVPERAGDGACEVVVIQIQAYEWLPRPPITPKSDILTQDYSRSFCLWIHRAIHGNYRVCGWDYAWSLKTKSPKATCHPMIWLQPLQRGRGNWMQAEMCPVRLDCIVCPMCMSIGLNQQGGCPDVNTHLQLSKLGGNVASETVLVKLAAIANTTSPSLRECYILLDCD